MNSTSRYVQRFERRVLGYIQRHSLIPTGATVLEAVSGGPDSTALLLALSESRSALSLGLYAAHFNHKLRGAAAAARDLAFVSNLAKSHDISLLTDEGDVRDYARAKKLSLEEAARHLRYQFLERAATQVGATIVATGHTADDQAETVLMHLIHGSGTDGLAGMRPRTSWPLGGAPALTLVRPLLEMTRDETEKHCQAHGVTPCLDPTNWSLAPVRNRIRHELLPMLRRYNPAIVKALCRLAESAAIDSEYLSMQAEQVWTDVAQVKGDSVIFDRSRLTPLHSAIRRRLLRRAMSLLTEPTANLKSYHLTMADQAVSSPKREYRLSLPGGTILNVNQELVALARSTPTTVTLPQAVRLPVPGRVTCSPWVIHSDLIAASAFRPSEHPYQASLDFDKAGSVLSVRPRLPGDRFRPLGMTGTKKLQDFLVDAKVPREERDRLPLVCAADGRILWVVGYRISEDAKVTADTTRVVHLRAQLA